MVEVILISLIAAPLVLTYLLRSNAALGFLALCTGFAAATYASGSTQHWLDHLTASGQLLSTNAVNLIMIAGPLLLTLLLTRKHVKRSGFYAQAVPALAAGGLLALTTAPLLAGWLNIDFSSVSLWGQLQKQAAIIVGVGALTSLVLVWMTNSKRHSRKHK